MASTTTRITVQELKNETENALLVVTKDGRDVWLPFSQIVSIHRGQPPSLEVTKWIADKEDLA